MGIVRSSRSWFEVVEKIIQQEGAIKEGIEDHEAEADDERKARPSHKDAAMAVVVIFERLADSAGVERPMK